VVRFDTDDGRSAMMIHIRLTIWPDEITAERLAELSGQWPRHATSAGLQLEMISEDDPDARAILARLHEWGYRRYANTGEPFVKGVDIWHRRYRSYDETDLQDAEFLEITPMDGAKTWPLRAYGGVEFVSGIMRNTLKLDWDFCNTDGRGVCCSQRVRDSLETQTFRGLGFADVPLIKKRPFTDDYEPVDWKPIRKRFWGLNSNIELPPCSPRLYTAHNGKIFTSREFRATPREWGFNDVEWWYRRSELESAGAFDVARVWEHQNSDYDHFASTIIVSPRFYRYCREQGFRVGFKPVRIDEE